MTTHIGEAWAAAERRRLQAERERAEREALRSDGIVPCDPWGNVTPTGSQSDLYERAARGLLKEWAKDNARGETRRVGKAPELAMGYGGTQESELKTKADILNEAIETVKGRGLNYGKPEDNFQRIALLWNAHMVNRFGLEAAPVLTPQDVSMMMVLLKIARLQNSPEHHDSWVDVAGYAACGGEIASGRSDERD